MTKFDIRQLRSQPLNIGQNSICRIGYNILANVSCSSLGIYDPQIIGDKAKWFADDLEPVVYQVFDLDSKIFTEPWIDVDYEPSLIFDEDEVTPNNDEDDDSSSCHSSVGDLVQRMISGDINGATPTGPHLPPFAPVRASSPMPDLQASFSLPGIPTVKGNMLDTQGVHSNKGRPR